MRSFPNHHVQWHAANTLFLLTNIGIAINRVFSGIPLSVNLPLIALGTPYGSSILLLSAVRTAQLVLRGQSHTIRSSLLRTTGHGEHSSLRGLSRRCYLALATTQEPC